MTQLTPSKTGMQTSYILGTVDKYTAKGLAVGIAKPRRLPRNACGLQRETVGHSVRTQEPTLGLAT